MRKNRIRSEHCDNCGYDFKISLQEVNYCPVCGQENHNPRLTVKYYLAQMVENIIHFDSKTLRTIFALLFKPGAVTNAYLGNRRKQYSSPFRLFFFGIIAFFFVKTFADGILYKYEEEQPDDRITIRSHFSTMLTQASDSTRWVFNAFPLVKHVVYTTDLRALVFSEKLNMGNWLEKSGLSDNWHNRLYYSSIRKYDRSAMTKTEFEERYNKVFYFLLVLTIPLTAFLVYIFFYKKDRLFFDSFLFSVHFNAAALFFGVLFLCMYVLPWHFISKGASFNTSFGHLYLSYPLIFLPAAKKVFGFGWLSSTVRTMLVALLVYFYIYYSQMLASLFLI